MRHDRALLLDTNHLSHLARFPGAADSAAVLEYLERGHATLAVTLFQLVELSDPKFQSVEAAKALLGSLPHFLANPFENVAEEELALACASATGRKRRAPRVFARDTSEWGHHIGPVGGSAVDMIDAFASGHGEREGIVRVAEWGAVSSMLKDKAVLIRDPMRPLTAAMERHLEEHRSRVPTYADGLSAGEIISRVGGKPAFPGFQAQEGLVAERMKQRGQQSKSNDVFDEYTTFYAPYAAVTALDGPTVHRAKMAKLPCVARITKSLTDVPILLDRVIAGELVPQLSEGW